MEAIKQWCRLRKVQVAILIFIIMLFTLTMAVVVLRFQDNIGIDAVSYMSIANQYANGHFAEAVNGFWSPMISWLMAPLIKLGAGGTMAFMTVNMLAALFIIAFGALCIWRWTKGHFFATLLYILIVSPMFIDVIRILSPDLLVVAWILVFLATLVWSHKRLIKARAVDWKVVALLGAVGAAGYVIKLYTVPVFVATLLVWTVVILVVTKGQKESFSLKKIASYAYIPLLSGVFFLIVASPWIIALSLKYERFTIGSSFEVNVEAKADGSREVREELAVPPNDFAVSYREDPTPRGEELAQPSAAAESGGSIKDKLQHYGGERLKALPYYINRINTMWPFTLLILAITGLALLFGAVTYRKHYPIVLAWLIAAIYFLGYGSIVSVAFRGGNIRYFWPIFILAALIVCLVLPAMWKAVSKNGQKMRNAVFIAVIVLLPVSTLMAYVVGLQYMNGVPMHSAVPLPESRRTQLVEALLQERSVPHVKQLADDIKRDGIIPKGSRLVGDSYRTVVFLAYYLESSAYGRAGDTHTNYYNLDNPEEKLREYDIDYVISFTPSGEKPNEIIDGEVVGEYTYTLSCRDTRSDGHMPCDIRVIKLNK